MEKTMKFLLKLFINFGTLFLLATAAFILRGAWHDYLDALAAVN